MGSYAVLTFVLFLIASHSNGSPGSRRRAHVATNDLQGESAGAHGENIHKRSPAGFYAAPGVHAPVYQPPLPVTSRYPLDHHNRHAIIHTCWKPRPSARDVYKAITNALADVHGLTLSDGKEALELGFGVVTVEKRGSPPAGYHYGGYGNQRPAIISYHDIKNVAVVTILQSSSLTHLAWLWTNVVLKDVKPRVHDVRCLTIVLELHLFAGNNKLKPRPAISYGGVNTKQPSHASKTGQTVSTVVTSPLPAQEGPRQTQQGPKHSGSGSALIKLKANPTPATATDQKKETVPSSEPTHKHSVSSSDKMTPTQAAQPRPLQVGVDLMPPEADELAGGHAEVPAISDAAMLHPGSDFLEGDIKGGLGLAVDPATGKLTYESNLASGKAGGVAEGDALAETEQWRLWKDSKLFFEFHPSVSTEHQNLILRAMQTMSAATCITFWHRNGAASITNYVIFRSDLRGCWSFLGMFVNGPQELSLQTNGGDITRPHCMWTGIIQHEIMHALGFFHEQSRADRDKFVQVLFENLQDPSVANNFEKRPESINYGTPYDVESIMHYGLRAFAKLGTQSLRTIGPFANIDPSRVGQRIRMGPEDVNMIRRAYGCDKVTFSASTSTEGARVQNGCDWVRNDAVSSVPSTAEECPKKCKELQNCTHFTWTDVDGGTCRLQESCPSFPFPIPGVTSVCGYFPNATKALGCTKTLEA